MSQPPRKLQVFISSTYKDLREERQAVVSAVLGAGHIPAGMELFAAEDKSQMEVIRRWIDDSDVFCLLLGGRYGTIEPDSGRSYIQEELEHARQQKKAVFSILLTDDAIERKVKKHGTSMIEQDEPGLLRELKADVRGRMCSFADNDDQIQLSVFKSIQQIDRDEGTIGWIRTDQVQAADALATQVAKLMKANADLRRQLDDQTKKLVLLQSQTAYPGGMDYGDLYEVLKTTTVEDLDGNNSDLITEFLKCKAFIGSGVCNAGNVSKDEIYCFKIASSVLPYGLTVHDKVSTRSRWSRLKLSPTGVRFASEIALHYVRTRKISAKK